MIRLKNKKLSDVKDKQTKISSFFIKSHEDAKASIKQVTLNNVSKSNLSVFQLLDDDKILDSKIVHRNSVSSLENVEPETSGDTTPLKECSNFIIVEEKEENLCKNVQHNRISPKLDNKQKSQSILFSTNSPDFIPGTPATTDKQTKRKGLKRKLCLLLSDDKGKGNVENFVNDPITFEYNVQNCLNQNKDDNTLNNINSINLRSFENSCKKLDIKTESIVKGHLSNSECKNQILTFEEKKKINDEYTPEFKTNGECNTNCRMGRVKLPVKINSCTPEKDSENMCYYNDIDFFEDFNLDDTKQINVISLESSVRCQVVSVQPIPLVGELVLGLQTSQDDRSIITCVLCDAWATCKISVGDFIIVSAKPIDGQPGCWRVDNKVGSVVLHPDNLVSGTALVGSLFCMRKSVLSDSFHGLDADSKIMIIGSLLHTLLQEVLKRNSTTYEDITKIVEEMMLSKQLLFTLYSSKISLEETRKELQTFVPLIYNFVQQYISPDQLFCAQLQSRPTSGNEGWKGKITGIADIEENIWAPSLGLKGKVDVTVNVRIHSRNKVMPLELKTGRASFSAEHRGQVILYTMMMAELGQSVNSGLLLYLREGMMKEVAVGNAERRDLILLRNQLVHHLESIKQITLNADGFIDVPSLPEPINHHSACARCPYLTMCSAVLKEQGLDQLSQSNPLNTLAVVSTEHFQKEHIQYVFHWSGLLRLEYAETQKNGMKIQDIWTLTPQQREKNGNCLSNVKLVGSVKEVINGYYEHTFTWTGNRNLSINEGEYLIVSSSTRMAVAAGTVRSVMDNVASLYLERDLSLRGENTWHLDRYESQSFLMFNLTNLGCLLDNTEEAQRIRQFVVSLDIPEFAPKLSSKILKVGGDLLASLNAGQKSAVFQTLAARQYVLIKGMPGTGKTATVVALVILAVRLGQSVLITSHTHSAVDNVLLRLKGKVDFLRLGSSKRLHSDLVQYGEDNHSCTTPDQLETFYNSKPVVGVTCLGSAHPLLRRRKFDLCLVDEATQVLQPTVLRPLFSAKKFILVGDPEQLSPLVKSQEAKKMGLGVSLFERLDRPAVTTVLTSQYRMNETVTKLANHLTYNGNLTCGNESVRSATLKPNIYMDDQPNWVKSALSSELENAVIVLDAIDVSPSGSDNCSNKFEADVVLQLLQVLKKNGIPENEIGVIAPYRAQVLLLKQETANKNISVEVNTVDQYQGRDKDVIIYSCTRSSQAKEFDILSDQKRMTVAVTRARHKLIFIGNVQLLRGYTVFQKIFSFIPESKFISVLKAS